MFNAFRMSLVSLLLVVGCVAERAPTPDEATASDEAGDDTSQAVSQLGDDALANPGPEPQTCALRICRTVADCTCGHAACENGSCVQILN
jgi:hypothetical protein